MGQSKGFLGVRRHTLALRAGCQGLGLEVLVVQVMGELSLRGYLLIDPAGLTLTLLGRALDLKQFLVWWRERCPHDWVREWEILNEEDLLAEDLESTGVLDIQVVAGGETGSVVLPCAPDLGLTPELAFQLMDEGNPRQAYAPALSLGSGPRYSLMTKVPFLRMHATLADAARPCDCLLDGLDETAAPLVLARDFSTCAKCGPAWWLKVPPDPVRKRPDFEHLSLAIASGGIVAAKGIGGFYWLGDATSGGVVNRLREFKNNPFRPFVVMYATLEMAAADFVIDEASAALMKSSRRPAVKCFARAQETGRFGWVQGFDCRLAVRLAATPFEFMLSRVSGRPLMITSANDPGHGISLTAGEVPDHHGQHAVVDDALPVHNPVEDSVMQHLPQHGDQMLVRSRGWVPLPERLPAPLPFPVLALGDGKSGVLALGAGRDVTLSPPLGDLRQPGPSARAARWISRMLQWTGVLPDCIMLDETPADWERPLLQVFEDFPQQRLPRATALCHGLLTHESYEGDAAVVFVWDTEVEGPDAGVVFHGGRHNLRPVGATLMDGELVGFGQVLRRMARVLGLDELCGPTPSYANETMDLLYADGMKAIGGPLGLLVPQWMQRDDGLLIMAVDDVLADMAKQREEGASVARLALTGHWVMTIAGSALVEWLEKDTPVDFIGGAGAAFANSLIVDGFDGELVQPIHVPLRIPPGGGGVAWGQVAACLAQG